MRFSFLETPVSPFDHRRDYFSVPTILSGPAAPSDGQGRPEGRGERAPSLTAASTAEGCCSAWTMLAVVGVVIIATCVIDREVRSEPLSATSPAASDHLDGFIAEASERFGIPAALIRAILRVEGGEDARIRSRKSARLMQFPPDMWTELRLRYALGDDPSDPRDNILAGTAHLREMYDRYGSKGFVAAYHVGPTRYAEHLKTGSPLPLETQAYVAVLAPLIERGLKDVVGSTAPANVISWRKAPLFIAQPKRGAGDSPSASSVPAERSSPSQFTADRPAFAPHSADLFVRRGMEPRPQ